MERAAAWFGCQRRQQAHRNHDRVLSGRPVYADELRTSSPLVISWSTKISAARTPHASRSSRMSFKSAAWLMAGLLAASRGTSAMADGPAALEGAATAEHRCTASEPLLDSPRRCPWTAGTACERFTGALSAQCDGSHAEMKRACSLMTPGNARRTNAVRAARGLRRNARRFARPPGPTVLDPPHPPPSGAAEPAPVRLVRP